MSYKNLLQIRKHYKNPSESEFNFKLNMYEKDKHKIKLMSKPVLLSVNVTNKCNLDCIMCPHDRKSGTDTISKDSLRKMKCYYPYLKHINWQGGEIFLVSYIREIFEELIDFRNIGNEITTNGLCIDKDWVDLMSHMNLTLTFSIDSVDRKIYEHIRRPAELNNLMKKIDLVNNSEMQKQKKSIVVVVMQSNHRCLLDFVEFAKKFKFYKVSFYPVMHIDHSKEDIFNNIDNKVKNYLIRSMEEIRKKGEEYGIEIENNILLSEEHNNKYNNKMKFTGIKHNLNCSLPWHSMWIDASRHGMIFPDCMCENPIGNIYTDSLEEVWNGKLMKQYRSKIKNNNKDLCSKTCYFKFIKSDRRYLRFKY